MATPTKTFTPAAKARIVAKIVDLEKDGSIGSVERLAGIVGEAARKALWMPLVPIDKAHGTQAMFDAGIAECRRIIAAERTAWVVL